MAGEEEELQRLGALRCLMKPSWDLIGQEPPGSSIYGSGDNKGYIRCNSAVLFVSLRFSSVPLDPDSAIELITSTFNQLFFL